MDYFTTNEEKQITVWDTCFDELDKNRIILCDEVVTASCYSEKHMIYACSTKIYFDDSLQLNTNYKIVEIKFKNNFLVFRSNQIYVYEFVNNNLIPVISYYYSDPKFEISNSHLIFSSIEGLNIVNLKGGSIDTQCLRIKPYQTFAVDDYYCAIANEDGKYIYVYNITTKEKIATLWRGRMPTQILKMSVLKLPENNLAIAVYSVTKTLHTFLVSTSPSYFPYFSIFREKTPNIEEMFWALYRQYPKLVCLGFGNKRMLKFDLNLKKL